MLINFDNKQQRFAYLKLSNRKYKYMFSAKQNLHIEYQHLLDLKRIVHLIGLIYIINFKQI